MTSRWDGCLRLRGLRAPDVCKRQHPDWLSAGVSVSDVASRRLRSGRRGRTVADARARLALELFRRQSHAESRRAAGHRLSLGHRRAGPFRLAVGRLDGLGDRGVAREPSVDGSQGGQAGGGSGGLSPAAGACRRGIRGAGPVRHARDDAQRRGGRPGRRFHPDGPRRRHRILARLLSGSRGSHRQQVEVADGRLAAPRARRIGRRTVQDQSTSLGRRTARSSRVQHHDGHDADGDVGRAGDAREIGGGYLIRRNLQLKLSVQRNTRDGGRVQRLTLGAAQVVIWF